MENRIDAVIDAATLKKVTDSIDSVKTDLPFLVELTIEEARRFQKMEDGRVEFVRKSFCSGYCRQQNCSSVFLIRECN